MEVGGVEMKTSCEGGRPQWRNSYQLRHGADPRGGRKPPEQEKRINDFDRFAVEAGFPHCKVRERGGGGVEIWEKVWRQVQSRDSN